MKGIKYVLFFLTFPLTDDDGDWTGYQNFYTITVLINLMCCGIDNNKIKICRIIFF